MRVIADATLVPVGTADASISPFVGAAVKLLQVHYCNCIRPSSASTKLFLATGCVFAMLRDTALTTLLAVTVSLSIFWPGCLTGSTTAPAHDYTLRVKCSSS